MNWNHSRGGITNTMDEKKRRPASRPPFTNNYYFFLAFLAAFFFAFFFAAMWVSFKVNLGIVWYECIFAPPSHDLLNVSAFLHCAQRNTHWCANSIPQYKKNAIPYWNIFDVGIPRVDLLQQYNTLHEYQKVLHRAFRTVPYCSVRLAHIKSHAVSAATVIRAP